MSLFISLVEQKSFWTSSANKKKEAFYRPDALPVAQPTGQGTER